MPPLRYVILWHDGVAEPHFDLMFETLPGSALATATANGIPDARMVLMRGFESCFDPLGPPTRRFSRGSLAHVLDLAGLDQVSLAGGGGTLFAVVTR